MRAVLIFNPTAGRARPATLARAAERWRAAGWQVEILATDAATGARGAARQALARGAELLAACGGDGTLAEIANEVVAHGPQAAPAITVLPFGTANVFARDLGLPLAPEAAARALLAGRPQAVPLGRARFGGGRERYFVCFASCGFDALIIHRVTRAAKRRWGVAAFVLEAVRQLPGYAFPPFPISNGAGQAEANLALCTLTRHYAGPFALYPRSWARQPYLITCRGGAARMTLQLVAFLAGAVQAAPGIRAAPVTQLQIGGAAPVQLDGEPAGLAPVEIEIEPAALRVWAP